MTDAFAHLPYRPCVGVVLVNTSGLVFAGARLVSENGKGENGTNDSSRPWQMPQGGIDKGEDALAAAKRELFEETNVHSASLLLEAPGWLTYDLPQELIGKAWKGKYRGQKQKWFAFRFDGDDSEINISSPAGGHKPEFAAWRWMPFSELVESVVAFKQPVYRELAMIFRSVMM